MREYLLVLLVAAAVTYLLGGVIRRFAASIGAVTPVRDRDVHSVPIPRLGGLSLCAGVAAAFVVATNLPFLGQIPDVGRDALVCLLAGLVVALVGALDDMYDLDPIAKLAGQVLAAGIVVVSGIQLNWLPLPDGTTYSLPPGQGTVITVLVIVFVANAVNFVDGLDGLAAGVVCLGASAFFSYSFILVAQNDLERAMSATLITAALTGACLGFLPHNFFPARVFLGDTGAYFLGLMLAVSTISLTGSLDPGQVSTETPSGMAQNLLPALLPLILPFAVLLLPFLDLMLAIIRRTRAGRHPFEADKQHLHHRMMEIGHSHPRAVLILYVWAGLAAFGVAAIGLRTNWLTIVGVVVALVGAVVLTRFAPHHPRPKTAAS